MRRSADQALTVEEVFAVLGACSTESATGIRNRALILALVQGLKLSEALSLRPADVGDGGRWPSECRRPLVAPLHPLAGEAFDNWRRRRRALPRVEGAPFFCTLSGARLAPAYVRELLPRLARRAGIRKRVHAEALRRVAVAPCLCSAPVPTSPDRPTKRLS